MDAMEDAATDREVWIEAEICDDLVCLYVEDSGPGISEEIREKLFEPFASSKKNGTGLGLAVSYGVVEAHGGRLVLVPSRHGHGACFQIQFPVAKGE
jgi:signal transduction histidine kinase